MDKPQVTMAVRRISPRHSVIDIRGDLSGAAESALSTAFAEAAAGVRAVVLNFSELEYMNSTGIGLLVTLLVRAKRQSCSILACCLSEHYQHIFSLTRLDEAIRVFATEAEAVQATAAA